MNHNGVISLPLKDSETLVAGDVVKLHTDGTVTKGSDGKTTSGNLGVVLHDVSQAATGTPAAIHLFNSGGIFNINVLPAATVLTAVGVPHSLGAGGLASVKGTPASTTLTFVPLEAISAAAGGMIQAIYIGA
jgi:hypothetical protein